MLGRIRSEGKVMGYRQIIEMESFKIKARAEGERWLLGWGRVA